MARTTAAAPLAPARKLTRREGERGVGGGGDAQEVVAAAGAPVAPQVDVFEGPDAVAAHRQHAIVSSSMRFTRPPSS